MFDKMLQTFNSALLLECIESLMRKSFLASRFLHVRLKIKTNFSWDLSVGLALVSLLLAMKHT